MQTPRRALAFAIGASALFLLGFYWFGMISGRLGMLFADAALIGPATTLAQWAALLTTACLVGAGGLVAVRTMLRPGGWGKKLLYALPAWFLALFVVGAVMVFLNIGTVGTILGDMMNGRLTLGTGWLVVCGILSTLAVMIAVARLDLGPATVGPATKLTLAGSAGLVVAWLGLLVVVLVASTSQPSAPAGAGGSAPGGAPAGQGATGAGAAAGAAQAQPGAAAASGGTQAQAGGQARPGAQGGAGGGGNNAAATVSKVQMGFGLLSLIFVTTVYAANKLRKAAAGATGSKVKSTRAATPSGELGRSLAALLGVAVLTLLAVQLVPVSRNNPPELSPIVWASAEHEALYDRACADCHSHRTEWPWYTQVAPSSWLLAVHVARGRRNWNGSDLDSMDDERRQQLAEQVARSIRAGRMPTADYRYLHPTANLTDEEKEVLIAGLQQGLIGRVLE